MSDYYEKRYALWQLHGAWTAGNKTAFVDQKIGLDLFMDGVMAILGGHEEIYNFEKLSVLTEEFIKHYSKIKNEEAAYESTEELIFEFIKCLTLLSKFREEIVFRIIDKAQKKDTAG
jgi:hypothetical protein